MKSPALSNFKVDPFVFAVYTSVGIFFVSVPLIIYLLAINEFEFELWSILGAVDIVIIGDEEYGVLSFKYLYLMLQCWAI